MSTCHFQAYREKHWCNINKSCLSQGHFNAVSDTWLLQRRHSSVGSTEGFFDRRNFDVAVGKRQVYLSLSMSHLNIAWTPTHRSTCSWLARWVTKSVMWRVGTGIIALANRGSCWSMASWTSLTAELICHWTKNRSKLTAMSLIIEVLYRRYSGKFVYYWTDNWQNMHWHKQEIRQLKITNKAFLHICILN